jgi:hypothetical protein
LSKECEDNEVKEYVSRSGQSQKRTGINYAPTKEGTERHKNKKDEINKMKSRVLLFLDYPHNTGGKLLWKVSNCFTERQGVIPKKTCAFRNLNICTGHDL